MQIILLILLAVAMAYFFCLLTQKESLSPQEEQIQDVVQKMLDQKEAESTVAEEDLGGSCRPSDGQWSKFTDNGWRSQSPCCQPPNYELNDNRYKSCENIGEENDKTIKQCLTACCGFVQSEAAKGNKSQYDASWFPMARCGCSLWCYNPGQFPFKCYPSAQRYISGEYRNNMTLNQQCSSMITFNPGGTSRSIENKQ